MVSHGIPSDRLAHDDEKVVVVANLYPVDVNAFMAKLDRLKPWLPRYASIYS